MSMISIIVPVYNQEKFLRQCVDSIIHQTYTDLEIILVDDGSTDHSAEICDHYALIDKRIKVIHKQNGGLSDARNAGIDIAQGEYLAFVDSDDFVDLNIYKRLMQALKETNASLAVCGCMRIDENGESIATDKKNYTLPSIVCTGISIINQEYPAVEQHWLTVVAWNKLYPRNLFENLRYPAGKYHEDEFLFHHLYAQVEKVVFVPERMYYYRKRQGSIVESGNKNICLDRIEALEQRILFCVKYGYTGSLENYERTILCDFKKIFCDRDFRKRNKDKVQMMRKTEKAIAQNMYHHHLMPHHIFIDRMFLWKLPGIYYFWERMSAKIKRMEATVCRKEKIGLQ